MVASTQGGEAKAKKARKRTSRSWLRRAFALGAAAVAIGVGLFLLVVVVGMATDDRDRVTTTDTRADSTKVTAPTGTPNATPATQVETEQSTKVESTTKNAASERSDALIVSLLTAAILLLLLGLMWGRVTSVEFGPNGLKIALEAIAEQAQKAKESAATDEDKVKADAAKVRATEALLEALSTPSVGTEPSGAGRVRELVGGRPGPARPPAMTPILADPGMARLYGEHLFDVEHRRDSVPP